VVTASALGMLVGAHRRADAAGRRLRVVNLQGPVERLLAMTGTLDLLTSAR
jgi:anti-anti-sigma factor